MKLVNIFHFLLISIASLSFSSGGLFGCKEYNIKLTQIMNLLCNTTQSAAIQQRDACSGCFLRAATLPPGPRQLLALSQCASLYLAGTGYQLCATNLAVSQYRKYCGQRRSSLLSIFLQTAVIELKPTYSIFKFTPCTTGYCEFIQCIRRTNAAILVWRESQIHPNEFINGFKCWYLFYNCAQVNACFLASMVNRDFTRILDRLNFFSNTTACILAKSRCDIANPITGELQQQLGQIYPIGLTNGVGTAGFYNHNALQIAPNGDVKIIAFPSSIVTGDYFCSGGATTLEQSLYDGITCLVPWMKILFSLLTHIFIYKIFTQILHDSRCNSCFFLFLL